MGCFASRFSKRGDASSDLNTCGMQFLGGDDHDGCPVDKIAFAFGGWEHKEVSEIFKFDKLKCTDEDQAKAIYTSTYKAVKAKLAELKDKYSNEADHKTEFISNKYSAGEAIGQLEKVLEEFGSASGIEIKDEEPAGEMMEAAPEMMEEMMAEGGMTMEEAVKADPHAADSLDSYKGWENLPGLFLRTTTVYPYFGDLVKTTLLNAEFKHEDKPKDLDFAGCAGLLSAAINSSEGEEKEVFFSGYSGEEDYEQLAELITAKGNLVFPGWIAGWESKEAAFENAAKTQKEGVKYLTPLIYKIKSKVVSGVACRYFVSRLACKITGAKQENNVWEIDLEDATPDAVKTVAEWLAEKDKPKEEPKAEEMMMEGEGEKMDDMMMEAPME